MLGPLLFLIYIDDLSSIVHGLLSKINLFADDILLYHVISALEDYEALQSAVSLIEEWSVSNSLSFNAGKCKYMVISRKLHPSSPSSPLRLLGCAMERVDCCKYLGLMITNNLSWSAHISSICSRAKKILGLIYRRFYSSANQDTLEQLYVSLVQPHLEYMLAHAVWYPHLVIKIRSCWRMYRSLAVSLHAFHQWDSGYQELLDLFELPSLEQRRLHLKLGLLFKIIHRLCYFPNIPEFRTNIPDLRSRHPLQLEPPFAHSNAYKFSFFLHTIAAWNSLSNECVTSPTYKTFMKQLSSV